MKNYHISKQQNHELMKVRLTQTLFNLFKYDMVVERGYIFPDLDEDINNIERKIQHEINIIYRKIYNINHLLFYILRKMKPFNAWILLKSFIYEENSEWYIDYFISKYSFYRKRREAINEFIGYYIGCNQ
ncbi:hypothetical protein C4M98_02955 [Mycoplasmopsis pullorum]|uniref:hypothetical protein n=1 Tax=Mycoplasmopsis pullorum TaxID=48003 RepID=UPI00111B82E2|nr:hypothetical protein [Mycoplasmopsis pullorum]TNK82410.1 hypothetical protein C4M94_00925 [Mycoplasmopsis pullorum]TNK82629.1 hypothetical protein C4M80_02805 [Mycoplasmopsis pullorum]TNK84900.1 hypothetical protein C4M81_00960 [Mycoplasmopsis pullorum]TNK85088.1 hypothetical protein C4M92_02430 [Mycoplasmopsis pullorum]TNK86088.1 hypothetical protein C4M85_01380 [Mycoplasmopsis pullorum]